MANEVVLDEWTLVLLGDPSLPATAVEELRALVAAELAATARRLTRALAPSVRAEVLPP
ncbi:MAG TPA: hypothetical protein VHB69_12625 [Mycobacteriales bacterium]|nr:hypothetical protein [Mycobacteriales bacterium]